MTPGRLEDVRRFSIIDYEVDPLDSVVRLRYGFDGKEWFEEVIELGGDPVHGERREQLEDVVRLLHLVAGVSYFKSAAPSQIAIENGSLTRHERAYLSAVYDKGLREFAVRNGRPIPLRTEITSKTATGRPRPIAPTAGSKPASRQQPPPQQQLARPTGAEAARIDRRGIGVPIGGGKDSIVVVDSVARHGEGPVVLVAVDPRPAMERTAQVAGLPLVTVRRHLAPRLLELNGEGALNGHVPVTAIVSLIAVAAGVVHGWDTTIMALERSADEATTEVAGVPVNHQWSKSLEAEELLGAALISRVGPSLAYGSVLRGCGELEIAQRFASMEPYHRAFRSCNRVFRRTSQFDRWCGQCPKCHFVFLMLAPFLSPESMADIFDGRNLLEDRSLVEGFRELFGTGPKPFECVGERRESLLGFMMLRRQPEWRSCVVVRLLADEIDKASGLVSGELVDGAPLVERAEVTGARIASNIDGVLARDSGAPRHGAPVR